MSGADPVDGDAVHDGTETKHDFTSGAEFDDDPDADPDLHIVTERECAQCEDLVLILSSRDWCDACELDDPE
jgi:hypothetical protein